MNRREIRRPGDRVIRVRRLRPWQVEVLPRPQPRRFRLSPLVLVGGFLGVIALGTFLLALPVASQSGQATPPVDALFTATSAVCVTGLVVVDTADYWSTFGQVVILVLIQLGGFGFMTSATLFLLALRRRISLRGRLLVGQEMGLQRPGGLVRIVRQMALFTLVAELAGAAVFLVRFGQQLPIGRAVWTSFFQSISAFNNAGFDVFGGFRSLTGYQQDPLVLLPTALLIIAGGISFVVVADVVRARSWARLRLDSKLVLVTSGVLLVLGTVIFMLTEYADPDTLGMMSFPQKLMNSFFQSVTARTAGFSTVNMAGVASYALFFTMLLMFIGGASGSTAGGIKVNTFGLLVATVWSSIRGREVPVAFRRQLTAGQVFRALSVIMLSLAVLSVVVFLLTVTETGHFLDILFEAVSAFGTVGLSTGITPGLSVAGRFILVVTMLVGRLGPLTLVLSLVQRQRPATHLYPTEQIRIG